MVSNGCIVRFMIHKPVTRLRSRGREGGREREGVREGEGGRES